MAKPGWGIRRPSLHSRLVRGSVLGLLAVTSAACGSRAAAPADDLADSAVDDTALASASPESSESPATNPADAAGAVSAEDDDAPEVPSTGPDGGDDTAPGDGTIADVTEDATEDGTDSAVTDAVPAEASPEVEALVIEVGRLYLSYDYRVDHAERVEQYRPLVTPELFDQLAVPLPAPLVETLEAEERVVTAEPTGVEPLEPGVFEVTFDVTESSGDPEATTTEPRAVIVAVGADQLVSDVR